MSLHPIIAKTYADEAHRQGDLMWQSTRNLSKVARDEDTDTYHILVSVGPTVWHDLANTGGFGYYLDDSFTAPTGQNVTTHATTFTNLIVNGLGNLREVNPPGLLVPMYNVTTSKVWPIKLDDVLNVRIQFTAANYAGSSPYIVIQMDSEGPFGAFISTTIPLLKAGDDQPVLFDFSAFVGPDWLANGGTIQVRYDGTGSVDLFNKAIQVQRTFSV